MYGAKAMLTHSATVTAEDPKTLLVTPYDPSFLPDIEAALRAQVPTMEITVGETSVRVIAPDLTGERRTILQKTAAERAEEAKQSIRGAREKVLNDMKKKKEDSEISEDEMFAAKENLQERVDATNKKIEGMYDEKLRDIHT